MRRNTNSFLRISFAAASCLLVLVGSLTAQTTSPSSDPSAIAAARSFIAASVGQASVTTFTASGNANIWIGSDQQTASVQVVTAGPQYTYSQFQSAQNALTEVRGIDANGHLIGQWSRGANNHPVAFRNLYVGSPWFFPLFTALSQVTDSSLLFSYVGLENWHGRQVLHVTVTKTVTISPKFPPSSFSTEFYLDPQTSLLVGLAGTLSPDDGSPAPVAWEVLYSNYVAQQGVLIPMHIEQYLNGSMLRQITFTNVQINASVPQSPFTF